METGLPADLTDGSVAELRQAIVARRCSVREVATAFIDRIEALDRDGPAVNAILELNPAALDIADARDARLNKDDGGAALYGIPVVLKANIDTADEMATSAGSLALARHRALQDAPLVAKLRAAGAVVLGKTNLSEWANFRSTASISGWSSLGGQTRNPHAPDRSPSGSSSGSAVAVAARLAPLAVGTETDGSIVSPAGANGVVGIKPTVGLIERAGIVPIAASTDTAGPFANSVRDAAGLLDAMTRPSRNEIGVAGLEGLEGPTRSLGGVRIGVVRDYPGAGSHAGVEAAFDSVVHTLSRLGAQIVDPVCLGVPQGFGDAEFQLLLHEFKDGINRYLATHDTGFADLADLIAFNETHADAVMPLFGQEIFEASEATEGLDSQAYRTAVAGSVSAMRETVEGAFRTHRLNAFVAPANGPAWRIGEPETSLVGSSSIAAVAGYPSVAVPAALVDELPVAVAFVGRPFTEKLLVGIAASYEAQRGAFPAPRSSCE